MLTWIAVRPFQVFLSGCTFAGNTAGSSAGAVLVDKSDLAVVGSTFSGNAAGHEGARANDQWWVLGGGRGTRKQ